MKKNVVFKIIFPLLLLLLTSFSFSGGPFNRAAGNYVFIPLDGNDPVYPFYENASEVKIAESLFVSAEGVWTLLLKCTTAGKNLNNELLVGRYQVKDDKVTFWDDSNCCTFSGKIKGDHLIVKPDDTGNSFVFVRTNSTR